MDLYKFLWWHGNLEMEKLSRHLDRFPRMLEDLDKMLEDGRISIHRADFGKVFISCPAHKVVNRVSEFLKENPGVTATEAMEALKLSKRVFYEQMKGLKVEKVTEGRTVRLYLETPDTLPAGGSEEHQRAATGVKRPAEVSESIWKYWTEQFGVLEEDWEEKVQEMGYQKLNDAEKTFVDEVGTFDIDFVMGEFDIESDAAAVFIQQLMVWRLCKIVKKGEMHNIYEVTYGAE